METHIKQFLLNADSKALATLSRDGVINVVPVSSMKIIEDKIVLVNYFMEKTLENILSNDNIALVAWSEMAGYQVKGKVEYRTSGDTFDMVTNWIRETIPGRVVKGVLIIEPAEVYDISPDKKGPA